MRTLRFLIRLMSSAAASRESMKSYIARDYFRAAGVSIRMRTFQPGRVRKSIASVKPILICKTTRLYRSISMNGFAKICLTVMLLSAAAGAADNQLMESTKADKDVTLTTNPGSSFWRASRPVYAEQDTYGKPLPRYRTEIHSRWTRDNLYFLFICPYEKLHLKPAPDTKNE